MNAYKKFSSYAEDIQKSIDFTKDESVLMIGAFPTEGEHVIGIFGRGFDIMASLCAAFDAKPGFKGMVETALRAHDLKMLDEAKGRRTPDVLEEFMKCFDKKDRS